ncbi:hypothetical protein GCM10008961_24850 [Deinococcus knuensis]|uniref:Uncharacterized protein n=1 Tax=Deinococcus knuensis TaxID=1837380 RepID=A0ABQ2SM18_9DEIO|nr:hypothetical protein GCM10008961_24850 [Deinococcus knuensis]
MPENHHEQQIGGVRTLSELGLIRTPIEWAAKPVGSERMRVGEKRIPYEPAGRRGDP